MYGATARVQHPASPATAGSVARDAKDADAGQLGKKKKNKGFTFFTNVMGFTIFGTDRNEHE